MATRKLFFIIIYRKLISMFTELRKDAKNSALEVHYKKNLLETVNNLRKMVSIENHAPVKIPNKK